MRTLIAGCLIVLVIALLGFGVAGYFAYRWAQPMIQSTSDYLARAREMSRLGDGVTNKSPHIPPANGELTAAQVDRFVAVQTRVRDELDARWAEIEKQSAQIREKTQDGRELTFNEFITVFSDLTSIYMEARREQVNALNVHKFSDAEYWWVRMRIYEAAGMEIASGVDVSKLEQLARDNGISTSLRVEFDSVKQKVPPVNIKLVRPHLAKLKAAFPLAILGL
jgi:hypothetical protein